uniref:Uncharacterized protein n=1 Tax=Saimiri boliviensis boliviensis TaxID=39432 RepID=A0A2K6SI90_SAIBB
MDGRKNKTLFHHSVFKEEVSAFSYIFCLEGKKGYATLFNPSSCESRAAWAVCTNFVAKPLQLSYPWLIVSPGDYCPPLSKCLRVS